MRTIHIVATVLVALVSPAIAFTAAPQDPPLGSAIYLTCKPPLDRSDRDPAVNTYVNVQFLSDTNHNVKSFDVIHSLFSGRTINRNDQYTGSASKKENYEEWYWTGVQNRDRNVSMVGKLIHDDRLGWRYQETVYKNGFVDHVIPFETCHGGEGD
jgi:hypothetical protein